ncbi:MAG: hypothetical protein COB24_14990 [Hyphomicrobiales bacterium]|nr:MAG: hypothetical protein COB24_14990 [Hyphomicrobiales bacterium]
MKNFLDLSAEDKHTFITEAAARRGLSSVIIEKDFWVCLALEKLFQSSFGQYLTFKGGTSLSKVYGLIERFSEDIDLTLDKKFINSFGNSTSLRPNKISKQSKKVIRENLLPELQKMLTEYGECAISDYDEQTILFHYQSVIGDNHDYIQKHVRIELGARGEREPNVKKTITPYLAEILPEIFENKAPLINVTALVAERTFWEKATILHSIAHQPSDKPINERMSRHYHDLYMLSKNTNLLNSALQNTELLQQVVSHKKEYFKESWDWYGNAKTGTFTLIPPDHHLKDLETDYEKTQIMLFEDDPISYDKLISTLKKLEKNINSAK